MKLTYIFDRNITEFKVVYKSAKDQKNSVSLLKKV